MTYSIRFDHLKVKALEAFQHKATYGHGFPSEIQFLALCAAAQAPKWENPINLANEWIDYGIQLIEDWDIRCCMKLVAIFPSCLPKELHNRVPNCDYDDKGHWRLYFE